MASASLFSAVRRGDLGTIRALLFPGEAAPADGDDVALLSSSLPRNVKAANAVNPNYVDPATQTTALHQAVRRGDAVAAALLLRHSATNPVARDGESGWTPMHYAAYNGDVAMALLLSKSGGAGAERDKEGNNWADLLNVGLQSESNPMEMVC